MSWVANLILLVNFDEDRNVVDELNRWLEHDAPWNGPSIPPGATGVGFMKDLTRTPGVWGGWKNPECRVWGAALNHADLGAVLAKVAALPWNHPAGVQILLQDQEQSYFRLWMLRDGAMRQLVPDPPEDDDLVY